MSWISLHDLYWVNKKVQAKKVYYLRHLQLLVLVLPFLQCEQITHTYNILKLSAFYILSVPDENMHLCIYAPSAFFSFSRNYDQSRDYKKRNTRSYFFKVIVFYFTNVF